MSTNRNVNIFCILKSFPTNKKKPSKNNIHSKNLHQKSSPKKFPPPHFLRGGDVMFSDVFSKFSQKKNHPDPPVWHNNSTSGYDLSVSWAIDFWLAKVGRRDMGMPWMRQGPGWDSFPATEEFWKTTTTEPYQSTHLHSKFLESKNLRNHPFCFVSTCFAEMPIPTRGTMLSYEQWKNWLFGVNVWDDKLPRYMVITGVL